jgi:hypothetical protein
MAMRLHERELVVTEAKIDLLRHLQEWAKSHDLTYVEELVVINEVLSRQVGDAFMYELRRERHGTTSVKSGEHHTHEWVTYKHSPLSPDVELCTWCDAARWPDNPSVIFEREEIEWLPSDAGREWEGED